MLDTGCPELGAHLVHLQGVLVEEVDCGEQGELGKRNVHCVSFARSGLHYTPCKSCETNLKPVWVVGFEILLLVAPFVLSDEPPDQNRGYGTKWSKEHESDEGGDERNNVLHGSLLSVGLIRVHVNMTRKNLEPL